jgi:hypothetical protein
MLAPCIKAILDGRIRWVKGRRVLLAKLSNVLDKKKTIRLII